MKYTKCKNCNKPFTDENVYSQDGWKETQISGICELCFDNITKEPEDEFSDEDCPAF